ncbi:histidine kinase 1-like protein [Tanacetum coccineum]
MSVLVLVIDIGMLNLSTEIWKEQLNFLDTINRKVKFAWILNHDTSNTIKIELRRRGHLLMVNGPLYKAKMIQVIEAVLNENNLEQTNRITMASNPHKCVQLDPMNSDTKSTNDSEISEIISTSGSQIEETNQENFPLCGAVSNCTPELNEVPSEPNKMSTNDNSNCEQGIHQTEKTTNGQKALEGLRVLLAEDTPILQRVATIMLERMGAKVVVVGDGAQAVEALNIQHKPLYDLILMDCQMPKMDGYEATKAIRRAEIESEGHIPIIALTAHAMSSDEAKCLEVGMDAYLTKPIDCKLMVSTILSLTKSRM